MPKEDDLRLTDHGTCFILMPQTDTGLAWIIENVSRDDYQPKWPLIFIGRESVTGFLTRIRESPGLTLATGSCDCDSFDHPGRPQPKSRSRRAAEAIQALAAASESDAVMALRLGLIRGMASTLLDALDADSSDPIRNREPEASFAEFCEGMRQHLVTIEEARHDS